MKQAVSRLLFYSVVALIAQVAPVSGNAGGANRDYGEIANSILQTYTSRWAELPVDKQKHWALRMYRVTGDTSWYPAIRADLEGVLKHLRSDGDSLSDSGYYRRRIESLAAGFAWGERKNEVRKSLFAGHPEIHLQLDLLYKMATVNDYIIEGRPVDSVCLRLRGFIVPEALADFLTDSSTIISYGPQAANAVEYLRQLDFIDVRQQYREALRCAFPDSLDKKLSDRQFGDKVYSLTHVVIAASGYYQRIVDADEFRWILDYFQKQRNRIVKQLAADVVAEVGLCFLVCDDTANDLAYDCQRAVTKKFDRKTGLIVSSMGSDDLDAGEHRNILTYILLRWSGRLYHGPRFLTSDWR